MPKKGGKKHNKKKGAGGGGGSKVPDVKNVISPGHKEEDELMYGEGTAAKATSDEAGPAIASGSTEAAPEAIATAAEAQDPLAQDTTKTEPSAGVLPKKEEELAAREEDIIPTEATKEQRGDERTEALVAAAPTGSKQETEKKVAKETDTAEHEFEHPALSHPVERADSLAATQGKAEPPVAPTTTGVATAAPNAAKKDKISTEETAGIATAGGVATAAGATYLAGEKRTEEDQPQLAPATSEKMETATQPVEEGLQPGEVATAAPLVAPHVKRAHEIPIFTATERDQPPKKPRVDESAEAQPNLAIPGRYPTPSVAGSTISATDSAIASDAQNFSTGETVAGKPEAPSTVTTVPSTQPTATKGPTEATIAAPAAVPVATKDVTAEQISTADATTAGVPGVTKDIKAEQLGAVDTTSVAAPVSTKDIQAEQISTADTRTGGATTGAAGVSTAPPTGEISAQSEPALPATPQKVDTTTKPTSPAVAAAAAAFRTQSTTGQQQTQEQQAAAATQASEEVTPSTKAGPQAPAQKEAKKGGFLSWIKRKIKGEKTETSTNGKGH